jgi:hypothetical protein
VVQALAAKCSHEPFRERVRLRRPDRRLDHPRAVPAEDVVKCRGELASCRGYREPPPSVSASEFQKFFSGIW